MTKQSKIGAPWLIEAMCVLIAALLAGGTLIGLNRISLLSSAAMLLLIWSTYAHFKTTASQTGPRAVLSAHDRFRLALACLAGFYLALQITGTVFSPLYPFLFLGLAVLGKIQLTLTHRLALTAVAACLELLSWQSIGRFEMRVVLVQIAIMSAFVFLSDIIELISRQKILTIDTVSNSSAPSAPEMRSARQLTFPEIDTAPPGKSEPIVTTPGKTTSEGVLGQVLGLLQAAAKAQTVAVYRFQSDRKHAVLIDSVHSSDNALKKSVSSSGGVFGAVSMKKEALVINDSNSSDRLITYYARKATVTAFIGMPVFTDSNEEPAGMLLVDKRQEGFSGGDEDLVAKAAAQVSDIWRKDRQLHRMNRIQNETIGLYEATEGLIRSLDLDAMLAEILSSLGKMYAEVDLTAILLRENEGLMIKAVETTDSFKWWRDRHLGRTIHSDGHLCAVAMKLNKTLPEKNYGKRNKEQQNIFGEGLEPTGLHSVKIVPVRLAASKRENAGVIVLGSRHDAFFAESGDSAEDLRRTLETISNIAAMGIQNARNYERLKVLAHRDELTGLHNSRRFFEMMDVETAQAKRYGYPLSLLMADVDHFKRVNDNYGHPVGDSVLKQVAIVLMEEARTTDHVCRYGGEEFAMIMPHTDEGGAVQMAERLRRAIAEMVIELKESRFSITLSIGIAESMDDAPGAKQLLARADRALYSAKENGRNRVVPYSQLAEIETEPPSESPNELLNEPPKRSQDEFVEDDPIIIEEKRFVL